MPCLRRLPVWLLFPLTLLVAVPSFSERPGPMPNDRRIERLEVPLTRDQLEERLRDGKLEGLDLETGRLLIDHIVDALPADWAAGVGGPEQAGELVDSHGCPIVNRAPGWPDWAQHDVDALRDEIARSAARARLLPRERRVEAESLVGNFVGQALVRGIDVGATELGGIDLERLPEEMPTAAASAVAQMHYYEQVKAMRLRDEGLSARPTEYPAEALELVRAVGRTPGDVLAVQPLQPIEKQAVPDLSCYGKQSFPRGMNALVGPTVIWDEDGPDDASADVPIGFGSFHGYGCRGLAGKSGAEIVGGNDSLRVSTNGYATLFQQATVFGQSPGTLSGLVYSNLPIPDSLYPDGFLAPSWDDYDLKSGTGTPDRVAYKTEGSVPNRVFTVEWLSISHHTSVPSDVDFHTFQLKLFEANGNVEFHYQATWGETPADSATIGMENYDGTLGHCGPSCGSQNRSTDLVSNDRFVPFRPTNDNLEGAGCLLPEQTTSGNLYGATDELGLLPLSTPYTNDFKDVWYIYHSPVDSTVVFDTCTEPAGLSVDTTMMVYELEPFVFPDLLATNRNGCPGNEGSWIDLDVSAGDTLLVRVAGNDGSEGKFQLRVRPSGNLDLAWNAKDDANVLATSGSGRSTTIDNTGCGQYALVEGDWVSEWHEYTATEDGPVYFTTCEPAGLAGAWFDTTLRVFDSLDDQFVSVVAESDDDPSCPSSSARSTVRWDASAGETYWIRVGGRNGARGEYDYAWGPESIFSDDFESGDLLAWD